MFRGMPLDSALPLLRTWAPQLDSALALEAQAEGQMAPEQAQYFHENVGLGLLLDARQTEAALKLADALQAADTTRMWQLAWQARAPLDDLENQLLWAEHPPFDRWYHETWIRSTFSANNPHRPYVQLRALLTSHGREILEPPPFFFRPPPGMTAQPGTQAPPAAQPAPAQPRSEVPAEGPARPPARPPQ